MRRFLPALLLLLLAACQVREQVDFLQSPGVGNALRPVLVGTTRGADPNQPVPGWERNPQVTYGRYVVSIPPDREVGTIPRQRPRQVADPERHFMLAESVQETPAEFVAALRAELAQQPSNQHEAVVFIHGFNTAFIEGVYRTAQLDYDLRIPGVMLHYSWPSLGAPLAYAHDRDSALFARDGLIDMLHQVRQAGPRRIILMAHSMGSHLLMETLRQMALTRDPTLRQIGGVILISPDVDVELFRQQVRTIGTLPEPFLIITSQRDRILALSASLTGERSRLGNLPDATAVEGLGVTLVDVSAFGQGSGHFTAGSSPALIGLLDQMNALNVALGSENAGSVPLLPATILTLQSTTEVILTPFTEISGEVTGNNRNPRAVMPWWLRNFVAGGHALQDTAR
ncbi:alpha/beta hydrolase [Pararhodobacter aggregans]|nr:alpha/beta fold hydrolase [Pararhodobacter aggregans]PTX02986.1 esterase/lipase superfamily enzyme [Pararhodobacter aggregans]